MRCDRLNAFLRPAVLAAAVSLLAGGASADVLYQTGFEAPTYTTGALAGQDGWFGSNGVVETSTVFDGAQAVSFDSTSVTGQLTDDVTGLWGPVSFVTVTTEIMVSADDPNVYWEALGADGDAGFVGQILVGPGGIVYGGGGTAAFAYGVWNAISMTFDFTTDTVTSFLNGAAFGSAAFASASTQLTLIGIGINTANGAATSQAYFDDVSITAPGAPEPASLALLGAGLAAIGAIRRRRRR